MRLLTCSTYSDISVICSRFTVCSLFQENKTVVISAKSIITYQIFAVSIMDKGMSWRRIAGLQNNPQSLPPAGAFSDVDCRFYSWKWEFFDHQHCGSDSLRAPVLVDSLVHSFALQGDVEIKHCLWLWLKDADVAKGFLWPDEKHISLSCIITTGTWRKHAM